MYKENALSDHMYVDEMLCEGYQGYDDLYEITSKMRGKVKAST